MDIFLEENCPNLIEVIKECGYIFEDVVRDPLYCVFGLYGRPELFAEKYGKEAADDTTILYGGSCKPSNAAELFGKPDIDGGLIGGASLKAADFKGIIDAWKK